MSSDNGEFSDDLVEQILGLAVRDACYALATG